MPKTKDHGGDRHVDIPPKAGRFKDMKLPSPLESMEFFMGACACALAVFAAPLSGAATSSPTLDQGLQALIANAPASLTREQAARLQAAIVRKDAEWAKASGAEADLARNQIRWDKWTMPIDVQQVGKKLAKGWPLIISLHGGGTCPKAVNDGQWRNQVARYRQLLKDCIYVAPRAPRDSEPWHPYMYPLLEKLISDMVALREVDPDRVYLMGYSEGGYACFRVQPGILDRFAGIAAGGAADQLDLAPAENLANVAFDLQVGEFDRGYDRIGLARKYASALDGLEKANPGLFRHRFKAHAGAPHDCPDYKPEFAAIPWMLESVRNPQPGSVIWVQGGWTKPKNFYWLSVDEEGGKGSRLEASLDKRSSVINLKTNHHGKITVHLNDSMINLEKPLIVNINGSTVFKGTVKRDAKVMVSSWLQRRDPRQIYSVALQVERPSAE